MEMLDWYMNNHHSEEGWRHVITNAATVRAIVGGQWTITLTGTTIAVALCAGNWGIVLKVRTYVRNKNNQCMCIILHVHCNYIHSHSQAK